jgi:hypothetical protein
MAAEQKECISQRRNAKLNAKEWLFKKYKRFNAGYECVNEYRAKANVGGRAISGNRVVAPSRWEAVAQARQALWLNRSFLRLNNNP